MIRKLFCLRKELSEAKKKLKEHSFIDSLTAVYNHRYFIKRIKESISYAQRKNMYVSLLKLDIERNLKAKIRGIDPKKNKEYFRKLVRSEISKEIIKREAL